MSLGLVVLEEKLFTQTRTPTPQSDDIKNQSKVVHCSGRPVCHISKPQIATVCIPSTGSIGMEHRCPEHKLVRPCSVCISCKSSAAQKSGTKSPPVQLLPHSGSPISTQRLILLSSFSLMASPWCRPTSVPAIVLLPLRVHYSVEIKRYKSQIRISPGVARDALVLGSGTTINRNSAPVVCVSNSTQTVIKPRASQPKVSRPSCLVSTNEQLQEQSFSSEVEERIAAPQRPSTRADNLAQ